MCSVRNALSSKSVRFTVRDNIRKGFFASCSCQPQSTDKLRNFVENTPKLVFLGHHTCKFITFLLKFCLLRAVPPSHCSEWHSNCQLVRQLRAPEIHHDPGPEGGLQLLRVRRPRRLFKAKDLQGASGPGHSAIPLPHCFWPCGGWRCGTRRPRDPHAAGERLLMTLAALLFYEQLWWFLRWLRTERKVWLWPFHTVTGQAVTFSCWWEVIFYTWRNKSYFLDGQFLTVFLNWSFNPFKIEYSYTFLYKLNNLRHLIKHLAFLLFSFIIIQMVICRMKAKSI